MSKREGRVLEGIVLSDKMDKTIVVNVVSRRMDPMYKRTMIHRKKYKVHDAKEQANVGDKVRIVESKPHSKQKRFELLEVLK